MQKKENHQRAIGKILGCVNNNGYMQISVDAKPYYAHRLAVLYTTGKWPIGQVDHMDGDRGNNAISNLRDVSQGVNSQNIRVATAANSLGVLGVTPWHGGRFRASITLAGKSIHLGLFASEKEAHDAYLRKKRELHEGCTI